MLSPFVLIGIGGSGGKTLRTTRADLERQLENLGWTGDFPEAWQFVHIDVPSKPDGLDASLPGALPSGSYNGLVASGVNYQVVDRLLSNSLKPQLNLDATAGWRPLATQVSVPIDRGAGQFRAIGRIITVTHLREVKSAIADAVGRIQTPGIEGQLKHIAKLVGADDQMEMREPVYLIVSSLAGGSGAGAVVDVNWALRAAGVAVENAGTILYAPDVFKSIPETMRKGIRPNALATLSELSAAWWNEEGISATTNAMYNAEGMVLPQAEGRAPGMILVGRKNSANLDYIDQNAVYVAMGRALSAWMTSEPLQDALTAYVTGNGPSSSYETVGEFPSALSHQTPPFRAIGYARVSLGRNLLREYVSEYLAREGVETVLRKHLETKRGQDDDRSDRELVDEAAKLAFRGYVRQCGLNERGPDDNDVLDALAPPERHEWFERLQADITSQFIDAIGPGGKDTNAIRTYISNAASDLSNRYLSTEHAGQLEMARAWSVAIQKRVMAATATSIARSGALVTAEMLNKLTREEIPYVIEELRREADGFASWAADIDGAINGALMEGGAANLQANSPLVTNAVKAAAVALYSHVEVQVRKLAGDLLSDLSDNFLEPLTLAVEAGRQRLQEDEAPQGAVPSDISLWPTGDDVPSRLKPSPNEFLLEKPNTYPTTRAELVARSVPGNLSTGDAEREAVGQIITGTVEIGSTDQTLIQTHRVWQPANSELRPASQSPQRAQFRVELRGSDLLNRANGWSVDTSRAMGRYLAQSLEDYLTDEDIQPEQLADRLGSYEGALTGAIGAAAPLAAIDKVMLAQVHRQKEVEPLYLLSTIPFPGKSEARDATVRVLHNSGLNPDKFTFKEAPVGAIDVFTALPATLHPVAFESLMKPIAEEWAAVKLDPTSRGAFWRWRRARSLPEFIPIAPPVRRAMVRGWFTASLLNRLEIPLGQQWTIFDPLSRGPVPFPFPLLQPDVSLGYEYLPAVLKSLPLAWLDCSTQGDVAPMAAYRCLRDLGGSGESDAVGDYSLNRTLRNWLANGPAEPGAPQVEGVGVTIEERRDYALDRIRNWRTAYTGVFEATEASLDPFSAPRAYELRDDILAAFTELFAGVESVRSLQSSPTVFN